MKYTADEYSRLLDRFAKGFPSAVGKARLVAAQQLRADIPGRIHRRGGTKDIDGSTRTYKSKSYAAKRRAEGLQANVVDHTFTGDLQRSYKLLSSKNHIDLRIFGNQNVVKARANEDFYDSGVWEASKKEEDRAFKAFSEVITDYIQKTFNG